MTDADGNPFKAIEQTGYSAHISMKSGRLEGNTEISGRKYYICQSELKALPKCKWW